MKTLLSILIITAMTTQALGQGDTKVINDPLAQVRSVSGFKAIEIRHGIDLYLTQGDEETVVVSASNEFDRDHITTTVENGVLKISFRGDRGFSVNWRDRKLRAYISVKNIESIKASEGSDVIGRGALSVNKLKLEFWGGSDYVGNVVVEELNIQIRGGSDVRISGKATNLQVEASGGSDFIGSDLACEYAIIEARGGSDARLNVSKELFAEASGGSDIEYKGSPVIKRSSSSGSSSITKKGR